jgi:hypothetical protein
MCRAEPMDGGSGGGIGGSTSCSPERSLAFDFLRGFLRSGGWAASFLLSSSCRFFSALLVGDVL